MILSHKCSTCLILLRKAHSHAGANCNYYKILGLSPSASQSEIKSAYFELSKKHHPDRNQGSEESAELFRLVKTAYEVLGSEKKRMQYDKTLIFRVVKKPVYNNQTANNTDYKDNAERMHYQSRARPPFRRFYKGKTTFYDFDAWHEGHYGKQNNTEEYDYIIRQPRQFRRDPKPEMPETINNFLNKAKHPLYIMIYFIALLSLLTKR